MTALLYAIVLAGGYAKRLWPLTLNTPKALLLIAGKPILDYVMDKLEALNPPLRKVVLSTNQCSQLQFKESMASRAYRNVDCVQMSLTNGLLENLIVDASIN